MDQYSIDQVKKLQEKYEIYEKELAAAILRKDKESIAGCKFIMKDIKYSIAAFY